MALDADEIMLPLPTGWVGLEHHLIRFHGIDEDAVLAMDSDELRRHHERSHVHGRFASGRFHLHYAP